MQFEIRQCDSTVCNFCMTKIKRKKKCEAVWHTCIQDCLCTHGLYDMFLSIGVCIFVSIVYCIVYCIIIYCLLYYYLLSIVSIVYCFVYRCLGKKKAEPIARCFVNLARTLHVSCSRIDEDGTATCPIFKNARQRSLE